MYLCKADIKIQDSAFLDRVDIKQYVPEPCAKACYEILRTCYIELVKCGIVASLHEREEDSAVQSTDKQSQWQILDTIVLPRYSDMVLNYWLDPTSAPKRLWNIAEKCVVCETPLISLDLSTNQATVRCRV